MAQEPPGLMGKGCLESRAWPGRVHACCDWGNKKFENNQLHPTSQMFLSLKRKWLLDQAKESPGFSQVGKRSRNMEETSFPTPEGTK